MSHAVRRMVPTVAVAATLFLNACGGPDAALGPDRRAARPASVIAQSTAAPDRSAARYEIDFMQDMIDHHMMAVMTAEVCVAKAIHEELRSLCQNIIAAQSAEIEQMQAWLEDWYGVSYEPRMTTGMQREVERLSQLSGAEFEIAFMEMMIRHHERAIREARGCVDRAYHRQLRRLCESIIAAQSEEIALLEAWLCEWYGECAQG